MPHKDPEVRKEYQAKYFQRNKEKMLAQMSQWKKDNPEAETQHKRTYRLKNMGQFAEYQASRRAAKLQRTPVWSNLAAIETIYRHVPKGWHVDHIYPLQGKTVSGLHVPDNLQYLTPAENCYKGNRI